MEHLPLDAPAPGAVDAQTDQQLVDAFRGGDVGAFEELYKRHHIVILRRLTRVCGNEAVAEELCQETFLRAAQRMGTVGGDLRFRAWVTRIGTNLAIDHLRALKRAPAAPLELIGDVAPPPGTPVHLDTEAHIERRETARFVAEVLARLNARHRRVLILREIDGLDYRSIAERLGVSSSAVETLLFRARGRFREEYAKALAS